ncbi:hypothetical protein L0666_15785 [Octadecabacter sp. CECT 8868]|uniref:hypothetical protein n=1 Tax=Octadecabacter algicola TaxID=2909342 RepID=UPI001F412138|nr:hypothetical protein [Octadecabacter algicola]MCF2906453.1 hypothetical protein [Octadecabacter algicola]
MPDVFVCLTCKKQRTKKFYACEGCEDTGPKWIRQEVSEKKFEMLKREEHGKKMLLIFLALTFAAVVLSGTLMKKGG